MRRGDTFVPLSVREGPWLIRLDWRIKCWKEAIALKLAPWLYFHDRKDCEEALKDLAAVAYGNRDAAWTSHSTLVKTALENAKQRGRMGM